MSVASRKEFIACVTKSKAIPESKLTDWLEVVEEKDPKKIAAKLVRDKLLTPWQAKFLLSGRSRLSVGNYLLRSRISRDQLGDKFEAIHARLNRKVVIQVFPSSIAKNEALLNKLLKKLRQITELDHPNLVHIYDVDQESERYFLVAEYVEGKTLDLVSPSDLTDNEIANIIQGVASGLSYAHESKILHGNITAENIFVTPDGKAELQGFPSAILTNEIDGQAKTNSESDDFLRLAKIGSTLLKEMPKASRSEHFSKIASMVVSLKDDDKREASLTSLEDWVSANSGEDAASSDIQLTPEDDSFVSDTPVAGVGDFDSPMTTVPQTSLKKKKKAAEPAEPESDQRSFFSKMWQDKRPAFIACCAALLLPVLGGLGYLLSSSTGASTENNPVVDRSVALKPKINEAPLATTNAAEGALAVKREGKSKKEVVDPEASRKALAEFFAKRDGKKTDASQEAKQPAGNEPDQKVVENTKPAMTETASKVNKVAGPKPPSANTSVDANANANVSANEKASPPAAKPQTIDLTRIVGIADKMQVYLNNGGVKTMEQIAAMSPAEVQAALVKGNWKGPSRIEEAADWIAQAKKFTGDSSPMKKSVASQTPTKATSAEPKKPAKIGNPFEKFAKLIDLPAETETTDLKIGGLVIAKNHLLGLELLAGPEIARGKTELKLKRTPNDKQLWDVELGIKRSDPVAVAQFQKTPTEMKFRWLPAAAEHKGASALRNCKLKLSTPKDSSWLGLRKPVSIVDFKFGEESAFTKAETELKWLPNPAALKIELQPFRLKGEDNRIGFSPREVTKREPGRIFFRERESERFFFIDVTANVRKRTQFAAQMTVLLPNGNPQALRSKSQLVDYTNAIGLQSQEAGYQHKLLEEKKAKKGEATELNRLKKESEKNLNRLTSAFDLSNQYIEISKQMTGKKIPLQVYFDMDGHRIVIAESKAD